jgi:hypothetical protein
VFHGKGPPERSVSSGSTAAAVAKWPNSLGGCGISDVGKVNGRR